MKKLLPLGSVVQIKESTENIMIIARMVRNLETEVYDYCGCILPKGVIDRDCLKFFNHNDIISLQFIGFQNEEEIKFNFALCLHEKELKAGI